MKRFLIGLTTILLLPHAPVWAAAQTPPELPGIELPGPEGSGAFGSEVVALPNGKSW